jgi:uncharacterized Fe-S cluster-containing MiaB family protein
VIEAGDTIQWVFDCLGIDEAYLGALCIAPGSGYESFWRSGTMTPPTLSEVFEVLTASIRRYGKRLHLLPYEDHPEFVAVPSNHIPGGIRQDFLNAEGCDREFHAMLQRFRETLDPGVLVPPECSCRAV